jgi:membrane protein required for colicin V production
MHVVDMLVLGALLIGVVLGLLRGFLTQITGVAGILGGLWLADRYHEGLRVRVVDRFLSGTHNGIVAFMAILITTILTAALVSWALRKVVDNLELGTYDRVMGALFGSLKAALVCAGLLLAVATFAPSNGGLMRAIGDSRSGPLLWEGMDRVAAWLPGEYGARASHYVQRTRPEPPPDTAGQPNPHDLDPHAAPRLPEALPDELRPPDPGTPDTSGTPGPDAATSLTVPEEPERPAVDDPR